MGGEVNRKLAVLAILQLPICAATLTFEPAPEITLRVVNEANIDSSVLSHSEKAAATILSEAGVHVSWLNCVAGYVNWKAADDCSRLPGPRQLDLRIVNQRPRVVDPFALGFTVIPNPPGEVRPFAAVFYPGVERFVREWNADAFQVVASAMAHEIGHLLLGPDAHSSRGIMSAHWGRQQWIRMSIGSFLFTPEEAARLRHVIAGL
jgi:hypothetical protein